MNNAIVAALASLAIGVGVGWSIKPTGDPAPSPETAAGGSRPGPSEATPSTPPPGPAPAKSGRAPESPGTEDSDMPWNVPQPGEGAGAFGGALGEVVLGLDPEIALRQTEERQIRMKRRHDLQIADFARRLDLTPAQQEQLRESYFAGLLEQDRFWNTPREEAAPAPEIPSLGEALGAILTEEQAAAYGELRARNLRAAARSEVLEKLAELSFLDLTREQSEKIFNAGMEELEAEMAEEGEPVELRAVGGALVGAVIGNSVGDGGAEGGALIGAIIGAPTGPDGADQEVVRAQQQAATDRLIEQRISDLAEYLTPVQVEDYRIHLEQSYTQGPHFYHPPDLYLPPLTEK